MRVMLDTNVIISALLFPSERMNRLFETIVIEHTMVISSYVIDELHTVVERKFPQKVVAVEKLLAKIQYNPPKRGVGTAFSGPNTPFAQNAFLQMVHILV